MNLVVSMDKNTVARPSSNSRKLVTRIRKLPTARPAGISGSGEKLRDARQRRLLHARLLDP